MFWPKKMFYKSLKKKLKRSDFVLVFSIILVIAIALSYAASKFMVLPIDIVSYYELQEEASPLFSMIMLWLSALGDFPLSMLLTIILWPCLHLEDRGPEAIFVLATASSVLIAFVLKVIIQRPRPLPIGENVIGFVQRINQYSYPSGHVLFFVVFYLFLAYIAWILNWA